jgi:hypothetical protein
MPDDPIIDSLNPFPPREDETEREGRIRQRAFDLWQAQGMPEGREQEHWLTTEREILMAQPTPTMGTPIMPGEQQSVGGTDQLDEPTAPKTSGASTPTPDTSKSRVANRDLDGPRKHGATPRPTDA